MAGKKGKQLIFRHFIDDAEAALVEAGAGNAEVSDFFCGFYVRTDAGTDVVVAYSNQPQGFGSVFGQFVELDSGRNIVACDKLKGYGQVSRYQLVDFNFHGFDLVLRQTSIYQEVDFTFLAFDVHIATTFAAEHSAHCLVQ